MKKYVFFRFLRSLVSIVLVTTIAFMMIYSLVPRTDIFKNDLVYAKLKGIPDEFVDYENGQYDKNGYIEFIRTAELCTLATEDEAGYKDCIADSGNLDNKYFVEYGAKNKSLVFEQYPLSKKVYATREIPLLERVTRFYGGFFIVDHPNKVQDPANPDLKRGLSFGSNSQNLVALNCSGCENSTLAWIDGNFPFIHQNVVKINLGTSFPSFAGIPVTDVIGAGQGKMKSVDTVFETGYKGKSPINLNKCTYKSTDRLDHLDTQRFDSNYADCKNNFQDPSMIGISMITGVIAVFLAYAIGLPAGIAMARKKGLLVDNIGVTIITVLISVPSLAFIYFFRFLGNKFLGLPDLFPALGAGNVLSYVLPTIILGLLSVSGLVIWVRRYMIDQQSTDYVKFAKAKGLSDKEISRRHIFRNAIIPIVNGIPGSIILAITGATITETIFAVPGMGKMLPDSILTHNNPVVMALVLIFTTLSILSIFLGDIAVTMVDPRINLNEGGK